VVLACRSTENCQHSRIIRALGWTNDHVYAETPDWVIRRLSQVPIQTALFQSADAERQPPHPNPLPVGSDFLGPVFLSFQMAMFYQLTPPTATAPS
jgi:hypothetical protein